MRLRVADQGSDVRPFVDGDLKEVTLFVKGPSADDESAHRFVERPSRQIGREDIDAERSEAQVGPLLRDSLEERGSDALVALIW